MLINASKADGKAYSTCVVVLGRYPSAVSCYYLMSYCKAQPGAALLCGKEWVKYITHKFGRYAASGVAYSD